jgi:DNA-binding response OmpR family regulator
MNLSKFSTFEVRVKLIFMIKLLLVEDSISLCQIIKSSLEDLYGDYEVICTYNGKDGLSLVKGARPDIIATDIDMPGMDGNKMIDSIREQGNNTPIIVLTGRMDLTRQIGADAYLKKPFDAVQLNMNIRSILKSRGFGYKDKYLIGKYVFIPPHNLIMYETNKQTMTPIESKILEMLCRNIGIVVKRTNITETLWNRDDEGVHHNLDTRIFAIRKYFNKDDTVKIENIRGEGYMLSVREK